MNRYFIKIGTGKKYCKEIKGFAKSELLEPIYGDEICSYETMNGEHRVCSSNEILVNPNVELAVGTNIYRFV